MNTNSIIIRQRAHDKQKQPFDRGRVTKKRKDFFFHQPSLVAYGSSIRPVLLSEWALCLFVI